MFFLAFLSILGCDTQQTVDELEEQIRQIKVLKWHKLHLLRNCSLWISIVLYNFVERKKNINAIQKCSDLLEKATSFQNTKDQKDNASTAQHIKVLRNRLFQPQFRENVFSKRPNAWLCEEKVKV